MNNSEVFKGCIWEAKPLFNLQPEVPLWIQAFDGLQIATNPVAATSFTGSTDVVVMLRRLCSAAGYKLEPNGVSGVSLSSSYLWGSPRDQILSVLSAIRTRGISGAFVEDSTLAIWPAKGARNSTNIPLIQPGTAQVPGTLIGYPVYTQSGIDFRCIYNPNIKFGGQVQIKTSVPTSLPSVPESMTISADGLWNVTAGLSAHLDAQIPNGKWESLVEAVRAGYGTPPVAQEG
jgi:hypothetical protein